MKLRDLLIGLENASQVEKIINENLKNENCKLFIDDGKDNIYIPKSRLDAKIGELSTANVTISSLNADIKKLQTQLTDGDENSKQRVEALQSTIANYEKQLNDVKIDSALQILGVEFKARDIKDLRAFVDMSKVSVDKEGEVTGLREQVETLQKNKDYLFNVVKETDPQDEDKSPFFGPGFIGKPSNVNLFGSQSTHEGDFGKALFGATHEGKKEGGNNFDADYFFKK